MSVQMVPPAQPKTFKEWTRYMWEYHIIQCVQITAIAVIVGMFLFSFLVCRDSWVGMWFLAFATLGFAWLCNLALKDCTVPKWSCSYPVAAIWFVVASFLGLVFAPLLVY